MTVSVDMIGSLESSGMPARASFPSSPLPDAEALRGVRNAQEQAYEVARQFESLLIEEVIKSARIAGGGWLGDDADATSESVAEMGEQFLARSLSAGGGMGLAAQFAPLIQRDLQPKPPQPAGELATPSLVR